MYFQDKENDCYCWICHKEGDTVCIDCGLVIENFLTHDETHAFQTSSKSFQYYTECDFSKDYFDIVHLCSRFHLDDCQTISRIYEMYLRVRNEKKFRKEEIISFVMYQFFKSENVTFNNAEYCDSSTNSDPVLVQMEGGVGYWNEKGELILETAPIGYHSDIDDEDEYDSNCEEYDGNDYPEEDPFASSSDEYKDVDGKTIDCKCFRFLFIVQMCF